MALEILLTMLARVAGQNLTALAVDLGSTVAGTVTRHGHDNALIDHDAASLIRRVATVCAISSVTAPHPITSIVLVHAVEGIGIELSLRSLSGSGCRNGSPGLGWDRRVAAFEDG